MYKNKQQDHEKRKDQEGSYSVYNYMYRYLMDNYEPEQLDNKPSIALESLEKQLAAEGLDYSLKGGNKITKEELLQHARSAISNFINNKGEHGDTANNLGKGQENSINSIARNLKDLRW